MAEWWVDWFVKVEREGAEVASDATDYFTEDDLEIEKTVQFIREHSQENNPGQEEEAISSIQGLF